MVMVMVMVMVVVVVVVVVMMRVVVARSFVSQVTSETQLERHVTSVEASFVCAKSFVDHFMDLKSGSRRTPDEFDPDDEDDADVDADAAVAAADDYDDDGGNFHISIHF
jgi:hypothetical protein